MVKHNRCIQRRRRVERITAACYSQNEEPLLSPFAASSSLCSNLSASLLLHCAISSRVCTLEGLAFQLRSTCSSEGHLHLREAP